MDRSYHSIHKAHKSPEGNGVILFYRIDRSQKIAHTLNIAQSGVVLIVGKQHVLHLFEVDIRADLRKRRVRVRMRNVFAFEKRILAVGTVDILFYVSNPKQWDKLAFLRGANRM